MAVGDVSWLMHCKPRLGHGFGTARDWWKFTSDTACPPFAAPQALAGGDAGHKIPVYMEFFVAYLVSGIWDLFRLPRLIKAGEGSFVHALGGTQTHGGGIRSYGRIFVLD